MGKGGYIDAIDSVGFLRAFGSVREPSETSLLV
jgi:hypothetical protein